jgi:rhamnopyranosyl-N-acetylglucosaminyl-diphospho-decaprenol beta-1,3/1,4-galactofuranosyltransferase
MNAEPVVRRARVAAAVTTYNRKDVLRQCLNGLFAQSRPLDEVIVVDNDSSDGTPAMVAEEFPSVRLVQMSENSGAAGGFAAGLREGAARGHDWVWVFNDDDVPDSGALATMLDSVAGLPPRTGIIACWRRGAGGGRYVLGALWRNRQLPIPPNDRAELPLALDVVAFSCTLVASALVRDVGVPKSDFFMMIEELEYCLRARRAGWEIYVLPHELTSALALGSGDQAPPWRGYYQTRNHLAMTLERRSIRELWWWSVRTGKFCAAALRSGDRPVERVQLRALGAWHAVRGVSGRTIPPTVENHSAVRTASVPDG